MRYVSMICDADINDLDTADFLDLEADVLDDEDSSRLWGALARRRSPCRCAGGAMPAR